MQKRVSGILPVVEDYKERVHRLKYRSLNDNLIVLYKIMRGAHRLDSHHIFSRVGEQRMWA